MNLSGKLFSNNKDGKLNMPNKVSALNPNAAEFVPSASRLQFGNANGADVTRLDPPGPSKAVLDRTGSKISNNSDEEAHQFWWHQLPDDITPDFTSMGEEELYTPGQLSLDSLSLHENVEASRFPAFGKNQLFGTRQDVSSYGISNQNSGEKVGYPISTYMEDQSSNSIMKVSTTEWDKQLINGGDHVTNTKDDYHYNEDPTAGLLTDLISEYASLEDAGINPVDFLTSQFPGFSSESLADVYYANGCDLNSTIEILTQLELQVDASFNQNMNSKSSEAPSFNVLDFPALSAADTQNGMSKFNGGDLLQTSNSLRFSSISKGTTDFASAVRKLAAQDSAHQKYERSRPADGNIGSSKSSHVLASYSGHGKLDYGDKVRSSAAVRAAPVWLETGEAVGNTHFNHCTLSIYLECDYWFLLNICFPTNIDMTGNMYTEMREDARDLARLRNVCFEQARQAYLIGNGALARELSRKGQLYNMQMKEAHGKARETIYRQRNPVGPGTRTQDPVIDLHGLHVNEAIHVLEHELRILRGTARSAGQRLQVMVCVGTGHHTKGARTPARLPVAVEQFLVEEGLHFTQPQPGLLRVVI
ncbi:polyadenylate-binding protein-interacting protein 7-like [Iris pallida]|uniref:Polyadenylate-binding protein-interacting protein 7-like n=1 Tax=Iris pallida TaxID=29817 RepID=A0AAX6I3Y1_IRIPA|nr:polyadenylate-binding protein-interacting protein 7-like [Iris pallida]